MPRFEWVPEQVIGQVGYREAVGEGESRAALRRQEGRQ